MRRFDPVSLLEATSSWEADEATWLQRIVESTRALDLGLGRVAYTLRFEARGKPPKMRVAQDGAPEWPAQLERLNQVFSPQATALVHVPLGRVRSHGPSVVRENAKRTGFTEAEYLALAGPGAAGPPLADFVFSGTGRHRAAFVALASEERAIRPERRRAVEMFMAHFAAMVRLRSVLRAPDPSEGADAVVSPAGRLLHATPSAADQKETLVDAVLRSERARGPLRRRSPDQAMAIWRALVEGKYTLVECVERDGKRLLFVRRNPARVRGLSALTASEAACAYFTALGHSQKFIAYELGLSLSASAKTTRSAIRKLRLRSPEELVRVIAPLLREPSHG